MCSADDDPTMDPGGSAMSRESTPCLRCGCALPAWPAFCHCHANTSHAALIGGIPAVLAENERAAAALAACLLARALPGIRPDHPQDGYSYEGCECARCVAIRGCPECGHSWPLHRLPGEPDSYGCFWSRDWFHICGCRRERPPVPDHD